MKNAEYMMTAKAEGKAWETGEPVEKVFEYTVVFTNDGDDYGNGYYMHVERADGFVESFDIRYDMTFRKDEKDAYILKWAKDRWSGKNGSYKLKAITIEEL